MPGLTDDQLRRMSKTAFDILNWSRRKGMKQDRQLDQVVAGFKVDLGQFAEEAEEEERRQLDHELETR